MGLDLGCYKEVKGVYWSASYSTFDRMRFTHQEMIKEKSSEDISYIPNLLEKIKKDVGSDTISMNEIYNAFYYHSDCDGYWWDYDIRMIHPFLAYTFEDYKKYMEDEEFIIQMMENLIHCLSESDFILFS